MKTVSNEDKEANWFAVCLLMPEQLVRQEVANWDIRLTLQMMKILKFFLKSFKSLSA
jgi:Zn-dependent peptidase ImmA (M78 family)